MKIRMLMPVLAVLLVFGLANTAFAQLSCSVASTPVSRDTDTGHTEVVGDLIFNCVAGGTAVTTASITIDYGVTITDSTTYPNIAPGPIRVSNATGSFAPVGAVAIAPGGVVNATGQVVLAVAPQPVPANGSFTLSGVLASFAGSGKTTLNANVSVSPGSNVLIVAGQNNATVVTTILPGIKAPALTTATPPSSALILSSGIVTTNNFSISITENYIDMYRAQAQFNNGNSTNGVQLLLTFAGFPTGVSATGCNSTVTLGTTTTVSGTANATASSTSISSTTNTETITLGGAFDLTSIETVNFFCTGITIGSTATIPLTPGNITVTATLAPTGNALSSTGTVLTSATAGQVPRYANNPLPSPALPVIVIAGAQTNFLIPFVVSEGGFDTGIAFANTTTDPFGATNGAKPQNGNIQFNIFPRTGSSCVVTPSSSSVGVGLTSAGVLESGRTYSVLLSELLKVSGANCPTIATGYIIGIANFTLGHGSSFVTDFKAFTSYSPVLIIPPPNQTPRNQLTVEALNN